MKIDKQVPVTTSLDTRSLPQVPFRDPATATPSSPANTTPRPNSDASRASGQFQSKDSGFSLQLNQQLTSMQSADHYLSTLAEQLAALKLNLSRQISSPQANAEKENVSRSLEQVNALLEQRSALSGGSLDATFRLRLMEPLRSHFRLEGLDSVAAIQQSGRETLVFVAGRALPEPLTVALDDGMSEEQVLRNFNSGLGAAGIRAELNQNGELKFSAPEQDWHKIAPQLKVRGEGKLYEAGAFNPVVSQEEGLHGFEFDPQTDSLRDLRQLLDSVVSALDRVSALREQIAQRQQDVSDFLARQESQDEQAWALNFARTVFKQNTHTASSYAVLSQTVLAQAQLTRFEVVSLLS